MLSIIPGSCPPLITSPATIVSMPTIRSFRASTERDWSTSSLIGGSGDSTYVLDDELEAASDASSSTSFASVAPFALVASAASATSATSAAPLAAPRLFAISHPSPKLKTGCSPDEKTGPLGRRACILPSASSRVGCQREGSGSHAKAGMAPVACPEPSSVGGGGPSVTPARAGSATDGSSMSRRYAGPPAEAHRPVARSTPSAAPSCAPSAATSSAALSAASSGGVSCVAWSRRRRGWHSTEMAGLSGRGGTSPASAPKPS
mmetsp:Transcript_14029/g.45005  ORF Transcript_14029/g.45005 Transcript_14029/m.45005 type:complete len:262 (-) Transcript_14029:222-1007(-)